MIFEFLVISGLLISSRLFVISGLLVVSGMNEIFSGCFTGAVSEVGLGELGFRLGARLERLVMESIVFEGEFVGR